MKNNMPNGMNAPIQFTGSFDYLRAAEGQMPTPGYGLAVSNVSAETSYKADSPALTDSQVISGFQKALDVRRPEGTNAHSDIVRGIS